MIPLLTDGVDVVTASPYHPQGSVKNVARWRLFLSKGLSKLYRLVLRQKLYTYTSCFRVYRRQAAASIPIERGGFFGVTEMLGRLDLSGHRIVEFPATLEARILGRSKMKVLHTIVGHLSLLGQLIWLRLQRPPGGRAPQLPALRMNRIGIVGGGLLGMALAARLSRQGYQVTILEAASRSGGLAAPARIGAYTWDRFYHVILQSDEYLLALLDELGLTGAAALESTRTGFYIDGQLRSLSSTLEFLTFPALGLLDKARLAATILYASRIRDWRRLETVLASEWLKRLSGSAHMGAHVAPASPGQAGRQCRAGQCRLHLGHHRPHVRRSPDRHEARDLRVRGGRVCGDPRSASMSSSEAWASRAATGPRDPGAERARPRPGRDIQGRREFDNVVLTIPAPGSPPSVLSSPKPSAIVCGRAVPGHRMRGACCSSSRWPTTTSPTSPTAGALHRRDRDDRAGRSEPLRGPGAGVPAEVRDPGRPVLAEDGRGDRGRVPGALERMYPRFQRAQVKAFQVSRVREMLAVTTLNYSATLLPPTATSVDRVFIVNSAQIANGTLNVNETLGLADRKARSSTPLLVRPRARLHAGGRRMSKPIASLSLDLDNLWSYQRTHGDPEWEQRGS